MLSRPSHQNLNNLIYIPYARVNYWKTIPFTAAHTYRYIHAAHIWQYLLPPGMDTYIFIWESYQTNYAVSKSVAVIVYLTENQLA